ncbi:MAG: hypothetical protein KDE03_10085 [Rhodobacteraceae bacterium]|nr:hypothetical protein [Paracoccaceae bacterium]
MTRKVILFGDSHLAALKLATGRIAPPEGWEVSFWGTAGTRFRNISWRDGCICPDDTATEQAFARFSGEGITRLDPAEYDAVVFVGARIRPGAILPDILNHVAHPTRHLTREYIGLVLAEHLLRHSTYQMAAAMAAGGKTKVYLNPISFETAGKQPRPRAYKVAREATHDHVSEIWRLTERLLAEDGITLIAQPVETIVEGYYTDARFGVGQKDHVHKNAEYGALILERIFDALSQKTKTAIRKAS